MREPMRSPSSILLLSILICISSACGPGFSDSHASSSGLVGPPPSPDLMQYSEDLTRSWEARLTATTWRAEIDDIRAAGPVHIITEAACPDRYHVMVSGAVSSDTYYLGAAMYQRKAQGAWTRKSLPMPYLGLASCGKHPEETADYSRIRIVAEQLQGIDLSKPVVREVKGRKCREWTRTFENGKTPFRNMSCYDLITHELVKSVAGTIVTVYEWNIPLDIEPRM
jgi:hypothetical protein